MNNDSSLHHSFTPSLHDYSKPDIRTTMRTMNNDSSLHHLFTQSLHDYSEHDIPTNDVDNEQRFVTSSLVPSVTS